MKNIRQKKIIELIEKYDIDTQDELASRLNQEGFNVTQATISRDIRQLALTKIPTISGKQKYVILQNQEVITDKKHLRILREGFQSMDTASTILVIRTAVGMAMAIGAAIDALKIKEVVGCIAGDDTVMCVTKSEEDCARLMEMIQEIIAK